MDVKTILTMYLFSKKKSSSQYCGQTSFLTFLHLLVGRVVGILCGLFLWASEPILVSKLKSQFNTLGYFCSYILQMTFLAQKVNIVYIYCIN